MKLRPQPRINRLALSLAMAILATNAQAGDGTVTHGSADISRDANGNTTIRQNSSRAIINWNDFSIDPGKWMQFLQPGKDSAVLNRVLGGNPSRIFGEIRANGQVFVINPNGVLIGPGGVIQAAAFMASTLDVDPNAFMAGHPLRFSGDSRAAIRNLGFIRTSAGDVILVGRSVENAGGIEAPQGRAALVAANAVRLDPQGDGSIVVEAGLPGGDTGVDNSGTIRAAQAQLSAAGGNVYALAVNAGGSIEATGVEHKDGRILLTTDGGDIQVDGTLKARNADGSGGTILVGGDAHGRNPEVPNAGNVSVGAGAMLDADAAGTGNGGKVVVWSDGVTDFSGRISARGGAEGGNGGFAEVSGKRLAMNGYADLRAPKGTQGTLLLDPDDIVIDTDLSTGHVSGSTSYMSAAAIANQLTMSNVTIQTDSPVTTGNGDITVRGSQPWTLNDMLGGLSLTATRDFILDTSVDIAVDATASAAGDAVKQAGAFRVTAGRDITLNGAFSASYTARGSDASPGGFFYASLERRPISFNAGRDLNFYNNFSVSATARGGNGGLLYPGGSAMVWGPGVAFSAGGDLTLRAGAHISSTASATSGSGSTAPAASGSGGTTSANGAALGFTVTGRFTLEAGASIATQATGILGLGGASTHAGSTGIYGPGIQINAGSALLAGNIQKHTVLGLSSGGSASGAVADANAGLLQVTTSTGGDITLSGNIQNTMTRDSVLPTTAANGNTISLQSGRDLIGNSAQISTVGSLFLGAKRSILLTGGSLASGNTVGYSVTPMPMTLVADMAYGTSPGYGSGEIRLTNTTVTSLTGTSIWGVSRALINLGTYTPASWGPGGEWRGFPGFELGVHCKLSCTANTLTIRADDKSMIYGAGAFPVFTASYSGFINGEDERVVSGLQFSTTAQLGSNVGTYIITPFGASAPLYYTVAYVNGVLTINPATLTVRANDASKVYGAALPTLGTSVSGLVNGDVASSVFTVNPTTTATAGSNVGKYQISPNAALLSGNYVLNQTDGTLTITAAPLTVSANDANRLYGEANPAFTTSVSGLVNGDSAASVFTADPVTTATVGSNVGIYDIAPNAVLLSGNYVLSQVNGKLTITAATIRVIADDKSKVYGAAMPVLTVTVTGGPASAVSFAPTVNATAGSNVGTYAIQPNATLNDHNYTLVQGNGTLTITAAPLTITARDASRVYGEANPAFTTSVSGLVNGDSAASVFTANASTTATAGSNAGIYDIAPNAVLLSGNYVLSQVNGKLTVNRAQLTVTANDATRVYGDANPAFTTTVSGLVNGDSAAGVVRSTPTSTATLGSNVGVYQISPNAVLLSGNYVLSQTDGKLTISPAPLRFSVDNASRVYGAANPAFTATLTGLKNGDSARDVVGVSYQTDAVANSNVGRYAVNGTATLSGAKSGNYTLLNGTASGFLTIDPATLTIRLDAATLVRGDTPSRVAAHGSDFNPQQPAGTIHYTTRYTSQYGSTDTVKWSASGFAGNDYTLTGTLAFSGDGVTTPLKVTGGNLATSPNYVLKFDIADPANWLTLTNPRIKVSIADLFALREAVDTISPVFLFNGLRGAYASQNNLDLRGLFGGNQWSWSYDPVTLYKWAVLAHGPATGSIPGDPYGPYDFEYDARGGTLQLVGMDIPNSQSGKTGKTFDGNIQLLKKGSDNTPWVPINIPPNIPKVFGLPVVFTSQINDIVSAYLRDTGQPWGPGDANNWLMAHGNDPASYGKLLPYLMKWLEAQEKARSVLQSLDRLESMAKGFPDAMGPIFLNTLALNAGFPADRRRNIGFGSPKLEQEYAAELLAFIKGEYVGPSAADNGLYDYLMAKLQNKRIEAADNAVQAYYEWKKDAAERSSKKRPTLNSLFDLGESPPDELIMAAKTGGDFQGDPKVLEQILAAAGSTWGGGMVGSMLGANLRTISYGIARGLMTPTSVIGSTVAGPATVVTMALQVAIQGALKIAKDANFEKNLLKAAEETRQKESFISLMSGSSPDEKAIAAVTMANLADIMATGNSEDAYAAISTSTQRVKIVPSRHDGLPGMFLIPDPGVGQLKAPAGESPKPAGKEGTLPPQQGTPPSPPPEGQPYGITRG